jgi:hypothetical protein
MANRMYPIILEEVGQNLRVSKKDLEADVRDMAEYWESCLEKTNIKDRDTAIYLLTTCINCYLKGKGVHFSNYKLLKRNNSILIALVTLVPLYVWGQSKDDYPKIFELMPVEAYKGWERAYGGGYSVLEKAEVILRDKSQD